MKPSKNTFKNVIAPSSGLNRLLLRKYPNLSLTELKVCSFLAYNVTSKEIGELTGRSVRTIEFTRSNIRKKMNLSTDESLVKHLILLAEEGRDKNGM
jgi:DNA-binding CsgD family transcriptional regulator